MKATKKKERKYSRKTLFALIRAVETNIPRK